MITPPQRIRDGYDIDFTNEVGSKLIDYVNVIKSLGEMYSLPVLDLYSEGGISKRILVHLQEMVFIQMMLDMIVYQIKCIDFY